MARQKLACPHSRPCQRTFHPIANISGQAVIIEVLKLTAAAERKMSARRIGMVQPVDQAAVGSNPIARCAKGHMAAVGGDTVSLRCDANDFIGVCHRHWASAAGMCPIRSSATSEGPARLATSACSQTALQAAVTRSEEHTSELQSLMR